TDETLPRVHVALQPGVGCSGAERFERIRLHRLFAVQPRAREQDAPDALALRAARVLVALAARMMLAVHRNPLASDHPRRQPEPKTEEMTRRRMQRQCPMSLMAMQEDRDARNRHVRQQ